MGPLSIEKQVHGSVPSARGGGPTFKTALTPAIGVPMSAFYPKADISGANERGSLAGPLLGSLGARLEIAIECLSFPSRHS